MHITSLSLLISVSSNLNKNVLLIEGEFHLNISYFRRWSSPHHSLYVIELIFDESIIVRRESINQPTTFHIFLSVPAYFDVTKIFPARLFSLKPKFHLEQKGSHSQSKGKPRPVVLDQHLAYSEGCWKGVCTENGHSSPHENMQPSLNSCI